MLKKTIIYTDFNGEKVQEDLYFNLTKADIMKKELSVPGGYASKLKAMYLKKDIPLIMQYMEEIILDSYGIKSDDGKQHLKNQKIREEFASSAAYSELLFELLTDADKATEFIQGVFPVEANAEAIEEAKKELNI